MLRQQKERTKVVVRQLPPTLSEESFKVAIDKVVPDTYNWFSYYPGKVSQKRIVHSRAYINFKDITDVLEFKSKFDGHAFVSNKGNQYRCTVEFAPYQKVPQQAKKKVTKEGTIERDAAYQEFLRQLEEGPTRMLSAAKQLELREAADRAKQASGQAPAVIVTPLMEFIRKKYEQQPLSLKGKHRRKPEGMQVVIVPVTNTAVTETPSSTASKGKRNKKKAQQALDKIPEVEASTSKSLPSSSATAKLGPAAEVAVGLAISKPSSLNTRPANPVSQTLSHAPKSTGPQLDRGAVTGESSQQSADMDAPAARVQARKERIRQGYQMFVPRARQAGQASREVDLSGLQAAASATMPSACKEHELTSSNPPATRQAAVRSRGRDISPSQVREPAGKPPGKMQPAKAQSPREASSSSAVAQPNLQRNAVAATSGQGLGQQADAAPGASKKKGTHKHIAKAAYGSSLTKEQ